MEPMPWIEFDFIKARKAFINDWLKREFSFSDLCQRYNISRKTGYKLVERFRAEGEAAAYDRSRARLTQEQQTSNELTELLLSTKARFPLWGPRKVRDYLLNLELDMPATSTVGDIFKKHGLVVPRKKRQKVAPYTSPLSHSNASNKVWSADFKGQFRMGNQQYCYPLTVSDNYSRYLLACKGLESPNRINSKKVFEQVFREYGLPDAIRTDNGQPFAGRGIAGLSRLAIWWLKLGITPERIEPAKPQQNGRHERMHRTLKHATASPSQRDMQDQQVCFDQFRREYNELRPHQSLDGQTPAKTYQVSNRQMPNKLPEVEYPDHMIIRKVRSSGEIQWQGGRIYISELLHGEPIGLTQVDDDLYTIYFASKRLGLLDARQKKINRL